MNRGLLVFFQAFAFAVASISAVSGTASRASTAPAVPLKCVFTFSAPKPVRVVTGLIGSKMVSKGSVGNRVFSCDYSIQDLSYSTRSPVPHVRFVMKKGECSGASEVFGRLNSSVDLVVVPVNDGFSCRENLLVNFDAARDDHPVYDSKEIKRLSEAFRRGVWP